MNWIELPGRILDETELAALAGRIAGREDLVRPLVHFDPHERHSASLHADEHIGIWVISWLPGQDTGWHDHAGSSGAVAVVEGCVREERPSWSRLARILDARPDEAFVFGDGDVHRVYAMGPEPAVTVHAYSPPLHAMHVYRVADDGTVTWSRVTWDQTLVG